MKFIITDGKHSDILQFKELPVNLNNILPYLQQVLFICFNNVYGLYSHNLLGRAYDAYNYQGDEQYLKTRKQKLKSKLIQLTKNIKGNLLFLSSENFNKVHNALDFIRYPIKPLSLIYNEYEYTVQVKTSASNFKILL